MTADRSAPRGGFTLIEVTITAFMLAASMTLTLHVIGWIAAERRASDRRQYATQEVANLMEHITARPWDRLTPESVKDIALTSSAKQRLPDADLSVAIAESAPLSARRVNVRLRWRNRGGTWEAPVRLSAWVYRRSAPR